MERFGIDSYLYSLSKDIKTDKDISNVNFNNPFNLKASDLRKELELFKFLKLYLSDILVTYRGKTCLTSPKNIKIFLGKECNGINISHLYRYTVTYGDNPDFFDVVHRYIFINTFSNYSAKSSYLHEITHTQLVVGKNIEEDVNEELLPMFIELIYGYINDTDQLLYKLKRLAIYIDGYMFTTSEDVRCDTKKYITSTLKAINLYHLCMNKLNMDREILSDISKVFNYNTTLEKVLDKYDISLDSSKVYFKELKKK